MEEIMLGTKLLVGITLGAVGFAILAFWIQLFSKSFDEKSKCFWPLFWVHMLVWVVGVFVVPGEWINDHVDVWVWPFMIYFFGSPLVMAIARWLDK